MGRDVEVSCVPSEETVELWVLGDLYRLWKQGRDRRPQGNHRVCGVTGLPLDQGVLQPESRSRSGQHLALGWPVSPPQWARVHMGLYAHPETEWTEDARRGVMALEATLHRVLVRLERKGCVETRPDLGYGPTGYNEETGHVTLAMFTEEGLKRARRKIEGTPLAQGPLSQLHDLPAEQRERAPEWARAEWRTEARA